MKTVKCFILDLLITISFIAWFITIAMLDSGIIAIYVTNLISMMIFGVCCSIAEKRA